MTVLAIHMTSPGWTSSLDGLDGACSRGVGLLRDSQDLYTLSDDRSDVDPRQPGRLEPAR